MKCPACSAETISNLSSCDECGQPLGPALRSVNLRPLVITAIAVIADRDRELAADQILGDVGLEARHVAGIVVLELFASVEPLDGAEASSRSPSACDERTASSKGCARLVASASGCTSYLHAPKIRPRISPRRDDPLSRLVGVDSPGQ